MLSHTEGMGARWMAAGTAGMAAESVPAAPADPDERLLWEMCRIYSPSGQEEALARHLRQRMAEAGLSACRDEAGNVVGEVGKGEPVVILLGHMDTVPGYLPVRIAGRELWGRGAVDGKGALAVFVAAARRLAGRLKGGKRGRLVVAGVVEEESASSRGARHLARRYRPDYCVIGEPSGWKGVTLGYKGRLLLRAVYRQGTGHSAGPGRSACEEAVRFWREIEALTETVNEGRSGFNSVDPSLRAFRSGGDGLVEEAELTVGFRLPPTMSPADLKGRLLENVRGGWTLSFWGEEAAFKAEKNTALVRAFLRSIREQGGVPAFKVKTGTSDMNVVGPVWGCPIVAYGPGDSRLDHTPAERLSLDEFRRAVLVVSGVLAGLMDIS